MSGYLILVNEKLLSLVAVCGNTSLTLPMPMFIYCSIMMITSFLGVPDIRLWHALKPPH